MQKVDEATTKRENMVIYLLINYPENSYNKLKNISVDNFKNEINKNIVKKLYEQLEKGNINTNDVMNWFEDTKTINHLSEIMSYDFEISDVDKAIDDVIFTYKKESLVNRRNTILKEIESVQNVEERQNLEKELNDVIIQLAKMK